MLCEGPKGKDTRQIRLKGAGDTQELVSFSGIAGYPPSLQQKGA